MNFFVSLIGCIAMVTVVSAYHGHGGSPFKYSRDGKGSDWELDSCTSRERQSPITLISEMEPEEMDTAFVFTNAENTFDCKKSGEGHALTCTPKNPEVVTKVTGGGLPGEATLLQFHFHWGNNGAAHSSHDSDENEDSHEDEDIPAGGSEHRVPGIDYQGELHAVYKLADGSLAVMGFFLSLEDEIDEDLITLEEGLANSLSTGEEADACENCVFNLGELFPTNSNFWRYDGSLTTPPCTENVLWTVFETPIEIDDNLLTLFNSLHDDHDEPITNIFRKVQDDKNQSPVYYYRHPEA